MPVPARFTTRWRAFAASSATTILWTELSSLPPHSYGEVAPSYGVGGVMNPRLRPLTPPALRATSPFKCRSVRGKICRVVSKPYHATKSALLWHSRLRTAKVSHLNHLGAFPGHSCV